MIRKQHHNPQTAPSRDHNSTHNKHTHLTLNRQVHSFKSLQQGTNLRTGRGTNPRTGRSAPQPTHNRQHTAHSTQHTAPTQRHATHSTQHNTQLYFQEQPPMGEASTNWVVEVHGGAPKGWGLPPPSPASFIHQLPRVQTRELPRVSHPTVRGSGTSKPCLVTLLGLWGIQQGESPSSP